MTVQLAVVYGAIALSLVSSFRCGRGIGQAIAAWLGLGAR